MLDFLYFNRIFLSEYVMKIRNTAYTLQPTNQRILIYNRIKIRPIDGIVARNTIKNDSNC